MPEVYELGDRVELSFTVSGDSGPVNPTSWSLIIATPAGEVDLTSSTRHDEPGEFSVYYTPSLSGPHVAVFTATGDNAGVATRVFLVTPTSASLTAITVAQLRSYLGDPSEDDATLLDALEAERAAQTARCRINPYNADLRQALLRRVARNLAARSVPVASFSTFEGGATTSRVPLKDPEIARLEGPYMRIVMG